MKLTNGRATFDNLIFTQMPGTTGQKFEFSSPSIDYSKLSAIGVTAPNYEINIDFRDCEHGESLSGN